MDDKELDQMAKDIEPTKVDAEPTKTEAPATETAPAGFVEDKETYVKPDGETTTTPTRNLIKEESGSKKWVVVTLVLLVLAGLGAFAGWAYIDAQNARNELKSVKTGLDAARADAAKLRADAASDKDKQPVVAELTIEEEIQLAASHYACATTNLGCDKTAGKVTKKLEPTLSESGFAIVTLEGTGEGTSLLLKSVNSEWIVIFETKDEEEIAADTVKRFNIPEDFVTAITQ